MSKALFYVMMGIAGVVGFSLLTVAGRNGNWLVAALVPIVLSPFALLLIRVFMENGQPAGLLSLQTQSWTFMIGDSVALPLVAAGGALAWRSRSHEFSSFFRSGWWLLICVVIGIAAMLAWHFLLDGPGYTKDGYADLLGSPSKLWHDFPVYGALSGGLVYLAIPAIFQSFRTYGYWCLIGFVLWGLLGLADNTIHKLNPAELHPPASQTLLR